MPVRKVCFMLVRVRVRVLVLGISIQRCGSNERRSGRSYRASRLAMGGRGRSEPTGSRLGDSDHLQSGGASAKPRPAQGRLRRTATRIASLHTSTCGISRSDGYALAGIRSASQPGAAVRMEDAAKCPMCAIFNVQGRLALPCLEHRVQLWSP
ncbi:hypothetical protein J3F83DRAFT_756508 [Trichoderma novae-zelandiae]